VGHEETSFQRHYRFAADRNLLNTGSVNMTVYRSP
jgi:hypothetical protein